MTRGRWAVSFFITSSKVVNGLSALRGSRAKSKPVIRPSLGWPFKAGEIGEYRWSLHGVDHTFLRGHRMMVQVQSSWFPLYDRNPQTYVDNIMVAPADAYKPATISIYSSRDHPSHLEFLSPREEQKVAGKR